ncbi:FecR family protein [Arenibacter troitsensis]|uniref:FecR family protein n=1 Tax=Arenibacter troitsensis TaxID=188872 RepID=A0A1X7IHT2_9FLAO|nr:FecR family protein [Arenibacter troitsensis]SMG13987.1 FecR family protein [Arenibacter troitsensis]
MKSIENKELFNKYIRRECSEEELRQIIAYFKNSKDFSSVPTYEEVSKLLEDYPDLEEEVAKRIYNNILEANKDEHLPVKAKKTYSILKYAAAAVLIGILATSYFLSDNKYNTPQENTPNNVVNTVVPGTDKATLTLGDGSVVALQKGNAVKTQNANSDGEKIVYKAVGGKPKEMVYNYLTIPRGGQFNVVLSDGTEVWLNSETQLKYPVHFEEGKVREVELVYGEAYFDVSPSTEHGGSKFRVMNKAQEVEVLGTEFNIKAYKDDTNVYTTLVEGKVVVGSGDLKQYLTPNQQSHLNLENNRIKVTVVDVNVETSWKNGIFSFKGMPLKNIMKVISRWYDVDVVFENKELESLKFKGVLDKYQSIEEILNIMTSSTINNYEIKNKTIIIK